MPDEQVQAIFTDKRAYLEAYQARKRDEISAIKTAWPRGQVDILSSLRDWFEPLMDKADLTAAGINSLVVLDCGETKLVLDFHTRKVYPWQGEEYDYFFRFDPALIEYLIVHHIEDWINELFLSCRFQAERKGAYNEYVYNFFKCLSMERLQYAEGYYAEKAPVQTLWESDGYRIQRRCPHLKADLTRFAHIEDGVLTCTLHGWQFEMETGRCLTSDDRRLYTQKIEASTAADEAELATTGEASAATRSDGVVLRAPLEQPATGASIRDRCYDCWYDPKKFPTAKKKRAATEE
jgi:UDP-MurNAc hydroxylase